MGVKSHHVGEQHRDLAARAAQLHVLLALDHAVHDLGGQVAPEVSADGLFTPDAALAGLEVGRRVAHDVAQHAEFVERAQGDALVPAPCGEILGEHGKRADGLRDLARHDERRRSGRARWPRPPPPGSRRASRAGAA
jgi:hypothetical protein